MVVDEISVVVDDFKMAVKDCSDFLYFGAEFIALVGCLFGFWIGWCFHNEIGFMLTMDGSRELF